MGGPGAGVLLPRVMDEADHRWMAEMIESLGYGGGTTDSFQVYTTIGIGGKYRFPPSWPFYYTHSSEWGGYPDPPDDDTPLYIEEAFGFWPEEEVSFSSGCNGPEAHQILADIVHHVALHFGGVIGFGNALTPPGLQVHKSQGWPDVEPTVSAWLATFRGKIIAVPYGSRPWAVHYCAPVFLRSWQKSPHFHMIK